MTDFSKCCDDDDPETPEGTRAGFDTMVQLLLAQAAGQHQLNYYNREPQTPEEEIGQTSSKLRTSLDGITNPDTFQSSFENLWDGFRLFDEFQEKSGTNTTRKLLAFQACAAPIEAFSKVNLTAVCDLIGMNAFQFEKLQAVLGIAYTRSSFLLSNQRALGVAGDAAMLANWSRINSNIEKGRENVLAHLSGISEKLQSTVSEEIGSIQDGKLTPYSIQVGRVKLRTINSTIQSFRGKQIFREPLYGKDAGGHILAAESSRTGTSLDSVVSACEEAFRQAEGLRDFAGARREIFSPRLCEVVDPGSENSLQVEGGLADVGIRVRTTTDILKPTQSGTFSSKTTRPPNYFSTPADFKAIVQRASTSYIGLGANGLEETFAGTFYQQAPIKDWLVNSAFDTDTWNSTLYAETMRVWKETYSATVLQICTSGDAAVNLTKHIGNPLLEISLMAKDLNPRNSISSADFTSRAGDDSRPLESKIVDLFQMIPGVETDGYKVASKIYESLDTDDEKTNWCMGVAFGRFVDDAGFAMPVDTSISNLISTADPFLWPLDYMPVLLRERPVDKFASGFTDHLGSCGGIRDPRVEFMTKLSYAYHGTVVVDANGEKKFKIGANRNARAQPFLDGKSALSTADMTKIGAVLRKLAEVVGFGDAKNSNVYKAGAKMEDINKLHSCTYLALHLCTAYADVRSSDLRVALDADVEAYTKAFNEKRFPEFKEYSHFQREFLAKYTTRHNDGNSALVDDLEALFVNPSFFPSERALRPISFVITDPDTYNLFNIGRSLYVKRLNVNYNDGGAASLSSSYTYTDRAVQELQREYLRNFKSDTYVGFNHLIAYKMSVNRWISGFAVSDFGAFVNLDFRFRPDRGDPLGPLVQTLSLGEGSPMITKADLRANLASGSDGLTEEQCQLFVASDSEYDVITSHGLEGASRLERAATSTKIDIDSLLRQQISAAMLTDVEGGRETLDAEISTASAANPGMGNTMPKGTGSDLIQVLNNTLTRIKTGELGDEYSVVAEFAFAMAVSTVGNFVASFLHGRPEDVRIKRSVKAGLSFAVFYGVMYYQINGGPSQVLAMLSTLGPNEALESKSTISDFLDLDKWWTPTQHLQETGTLRTAFNCAVLYDLYCFFKCGFWNIQEFQLEHGAYSTWASLVFTVAALGGASKATDWQIKTNSAILTILMYSMVALLNGEKLTNKITIEQSGGVKIDFLPATWASRVSSAPLAMVLNYYTLGISSLFLALFVHLSTRKVGFIEGIFPYANETVLPGIFWLMVWLEHTMKKTQRDIVEIEKLRSIDFTQVPILEGKSSRDVESLLRTRGARNFLMQRENSFEAFSKYLGKATGVLIFSKANREKFERYASQTPPYAPGINFVVYFGLDSQNNETVEYIPLLGDLSATGDNDALTSLYEYYDKLSEPLKQLFGGENLKEVARAGRRGGSAYRDAGRFPATVLERAGNNLLDIVDSTYGMGGEKAENQLSGSTSIPGVAKLYSLGNYLNGFIPGVAATSVVAGIRAINEYRTIQSGQQADTETGAALLGAAAYALLFYVHLKSRAFAKEAKRPAALEFKTTRKVIEERAAEKQRTQEEAKLDAIGRGAPQDIRIIKRHEFVLVNRDGTLKDNIEEAFGLERQPKVLLSAENMRRNQGNPLKARYLYNYNLPPDVQIVDGDNIIVSVQAPRDQTEALGIYLGKTIY